MDANILDTLEKKVGALLAAYRVLQQENLALRMEKQKLLEERDGLRAGIDGILEKIDKALVD